jgi:hypothetical protein
MVELQRLQGLDKVDDEAWLAKCCVKITGVRLVVDEGSSFKVKG